ncbi:quinone-dependent dihydroorotate dehydrogenase [Derxia lacustris]|uniref:quinone-dependent dihydroorotate dehydrogenase n=1 Tax=Derxia lacustris TaxID=764842 RepID=UPI000A1706D6|nr:quinone-dependent dihydroorotate dehydrogenase [Derxia lacustris]
MSLYSLARPLLFLIDPEKAHHLTFGGLDTLEKLGLPGCLMQQRIPADPREVMGLRFPNPVGLAAGLDKDGEHIDALARMGFGFIEVGTVTPRPQPGNPQPRLFRLPEADAIINRMGFNNGGVDAFVRNVQRSRFYREGGVLGLNIGKNASTPIERAADDYLHCLERVYPYASYVTVNISSPNTKNLRQLQGGDELDALLAALMQSRDRLADRHGKRVPLALKIAPDLDDEQIARIAELLLRHRVDGVIATNTTLARDAVAGLRHADEAGGLSGAPVKAASDRVIAALHARLGDALPIIGVGGVLSGADAADKCKAGARLVQLYTGLIYRGPALVADCARELRAPVA